VLARVKALFRSLAIYGFGDVATSLVSFLLLPVYTRYLTAEDYGIIAMLLTVEAVAKILFRFGVDTAFMRLYYDCADPQARQRLASTIFFFLLAINGAVLLAAVAASGWLSAQLFDTNRYWLLVALALGNTFVGGFYFIPLQVLRITERSGQFISLVFARSAGTLVARLVLVIGAGMGVIGVIVADVVVTAVFTLVLVPWFAPLIRPVFSPAQLRQALGFGLPRIPHSLAHQVMGLADRYFLNAFGTLRDVGLYSIGATFGLALKLFLSAFEYAWTPFFLGVMKEPDAKRIYSTVSTYVIAALVLLTAGFCAVGPDLVRLMTAEEFHPSGAVTPWIALGVMCQGVYLVGSIGLIITRKTSRYPLATGIAAATNLAANAVLIPRFGLIGAAWANAVSYATLAAFTVWLSWREFPIPYEWRRLAAVAAAGIGAYLAAEFAIGSSAGPLVSAVARGVVVVGTYLGILLATGFLHAGEFRVLNDMRRRALRGRTPPPPADQGGPVEMAGEIVATTHELNSHNSAPGTRKTGDSRQGAGD